MTGYRYFIKDQHGVHFLTFTVVEWIAIFTWKNYKTNIGDSLHYCIEEKHVEC